MWGGKGGIQMITDAAAFSRAHPTHTRSLCSCAFCAYATVSCLPGSFSSICSVSDLQTVLTFSKWHRLSVSLARTPKGWSVPPVRGRLGSPPPEWLSFWSTALYLFYVGLRIFAVMDPKFVLAHPDVLNSLTLRACQPSILHSPTPKGKICLFYIPVVGLRLN